MNDKSIPPDRLVELTARFDARAALRIAEIDKILSGDAPISRPALERLRAVAHEIRGSAGMFGRPALSMAAGVLEDRVVEVLCDQAANPRAPESSNAPADLRALARALGREAGKERP